MRPFEGCGRLLGWGLVLILQTVGLPASYNLHAWENYDSGSIPQGMAFLHQSNGMNTRVVDLSSLGDPGFLSGVGKSECGRYALELRTDGKDHRYLSVVSQTSLDRKLLGQYGKALFQADIYIKGKADVSQTVAVAAISASGVAANPGNVNIWTLYRFGIIGNERTYFSFTNGTAEPKVYLHQPLAGVTSAADGWHRFQLVFEGQDKIHCYVDGRPTVFSPIIDSTFDVLYPGIIVTSGPDKPMVAYMDNLSIQWTMEQNEPMPESPWVTPSMDARAGAGGGISWSIDPEEAWAVSKRTNKPLLMMFYNPASVASQELNNNVFNQADAAEVLRQYTLLRVDINQLRGGLLARQYKVSIVPTFIVLDYGGQPSATIVASQPNWETLKPQLVGAAK